jgi:hypothetical protein
MFLAFSALLPGFEILTELHPEKQITSDNIK